MSQKNKSKSTSSGQTTKSLKSFRPTLPKKKLEEMLTFTKGLARASGSLALSYYGRADPTLKFDNSLVTEADLAVQEYIGKEVADAYPTHRFLGEESIVTSQKKDIDEPLWVVDPVDGTAAFCAGMPVWGVSIALFDGQRAVLGVFYQPVTGELYSAIHWSESMLNDRHIEVRDEIVDNESLLLTYSRFHSDFHTTFPGKVRSLGSSAAHIAYVARGAACGAILGNVHVWDIAAGSVILEASGGSIRDLNGNAVDLSNYLEGQKIDRVLIAAAKNQHKDIGRLIKSLKMT